MMILRVCTLLIGGVITALPIYGQRQLTTSEVLEDTTTCEENIVALERVMRQSSEESGIIFIVSNRAKSEESRMDWARLKYTRTAITSFRKFPAERLKIMAGEPTDGDSGKLEFWVNGKLLLVSYAKRNQRICFHI